jgi:hypothetical protein
VIDLTELDLTLSREAVLTVVLSKLEVGVVSTSSFLPACLETLGYS